MSDKIIKFQVNNRKDFDPIEKQPNQSIGDTAGQRSPSCRPTTSNGIQQNQIQMKRSQYEKDFTIKLSFSLESSGYLIIQINSDNANIKIRKSKKEPQPPNRLNPTESPNKSVSKSPNTSSGSYDSSADSAFASTDRLAQMSCLGRAMHRTIDKVKSICRCCTKNTNKSSKLKES